MTDEEKARKYFEDSKDYYDSRKPITDRQLRQIYLDGLAEGKKLGKEEQWKATEKAQKKTSARIKELEKENEQLKKDKELLDNTNNEQTKVILELQEHIREVENDSNNCEHWSYTRIKQLEEQIEKMKCCGNCKHREDCVYENAWDLCDKWGLNK